MIRRPSGRTLWILCWLGLSAWFARPLWIADPLPLHDLPNHLARITALHYLDDPRWNLKPFYERSIGLVPYLGHFYPVHLMTYLFRTVARANLVYMTLYIFATPLCGLAFARVTKRDPWLAFLLLPLSVCIFFQWGFIGFCVAVMLFLAACGLLYRVLDEPTLPRAVALGAVTIALYLCHVLPWAAFGLYGGILCMLELGARRPRSAGYAAFAMLPSLAAFLGGVEHAQSVGYMSGGSGAYSAQVDTLVEMLDRSVKLIDLWRKQTSDERITFGLIFLVLVLAATDRASEEPWRVRWRIPIAIALMALFATLTPFWIRQPFNWWMVNVRFWMLLGALAVFLPRGPVRGERMVLLVLGVAASCLIPHYMGKNFKNFAARARPLISLIQRVPMGKTTLYLHQPSSHSRNFDDPYLAPDMPLWREMYNYPLVYRGGYDPYMYDDGFPIRATHRLPAPVVESAKDWGTPDSRRFDQYRHLTGWDYFIVRADYVDALPADGAVRVDREGEWVLCRNLMKEAE